MSPSCKTRYRLLGQFLLTDSPITAIPEYWLSDSIGQWSLNYDAALPVIRLDHSSGTQIGWMLGHPISDAGVVVSGKALSLPAEATQTAE